MTPSTQIETNIKLPSDQDASGRSFGPKNSAIKEVLDSAR